MIITTMNSICNVLFLLTQLDASTASIYIHIWTHTHMCTHVQTNTHTHTHTHIHTHTHTHRGNWVSDHLCKQVWLIFENQNNNKTFFLWQKNYHCMWPPFSVSGWSIVNTWDIHILINFSFLTTSWYQNWLICDKPSSDWWSLLMFAVHGHPLSLSLTLSRFPPWHETKWL